MERPKGPNFRHARLINERRVSGSSFGPSHDRPVGEVRQVTRRDQQSQGDISHLQQYPESHITSEPFRHPLPKLPSPAGDGRAFFDQPMGSRSESVHGSERIRLLSDQPVQSASNSRLKAYSRLVHRPGAADERFNDRRIICSSDHACALSEKSAATCFGVKPAVRGDTG